MTTTKCVDKKEFLEFIKNYPRPLNLCKCNGEKEFPYMMVYRDLTLKENYDIVATFIRQHPDIDDSMFRIADKE